MISKIDEIIDFLASDSDVHSFKEISEVLNIPLNLCKEIASFLAKYGFVKLEDETLKINPKIRDFIVETSEKSILQIISRQ